MNTHSLKDLFSAYLTYPSLLGNKPQRAVHNPEFITPGLSRLEKRHKQRWMTQQTHIHHK